MILIYLLQLDSSLFSTNFDIPFSHPLELFLCSYSSDGFSVLLSARIVALSQSSLVFTGDWMNMQFLISLQLITLMLLIDTGVSELEMLHSQVFFAATIN